MKLTILDIAEILLKDPLLLELQFYSVETNKVLIAK